MIRQGDLFMRLIIDRSHGRVRLMDYRAGNYDAKREMLDALAAEEGVHKIFTVVEKQDSNCWRSAGFFREAVYPNFFRTADAYMMSRLYGMDGAPLGSDPVKPSAEEQTRFPGRKVGKPDGLGVTVLGDEGARAQVLAEADGELRALPFSRVKAPDLVYQARARGNRRAFACAEVDESFGHAMVGFAPIPDDVGPLTLCAHAGNALLGDLRRREVANVFGVSPLADRWTNELFAGLGFKVTGRLAGHLRAGDAYQNALLWHCRLGQREAG